MDWTTFFVAAAGFVAAVTTAVGGWYLKVLQMHMAAKKDEAAAEADVETSAQVSLREIIADLRAERARDKETFTADIASVRKLAMDDRDECRRELNELRTKYLELERREARVSAELEILKAQYAQLVGNQSTMRTTINEMKKETQ